MPDRTPPRVIELITVFAVASILAAVLLPHCPQARAPHSGRTPAASPAKP